MKVMLLLLLILALCSSQYSEPFGKQLCKLAISSYCRPVHIESWSCDFCKQSQLGIRNVSLIVNSSSSTLGFIAISQKLSSIIRRCDYQVLVFRGTLPWKIQNDISDMNYRSISYTLCQQNLNCKVHEGFYRAYQNINKQVIQKVQLYKMLFGFSKIIIVGHSLGASLATHAVAHLIKDNHQIDSFYTLGSFRIGNYQFVKWFQNLNKNLLRPRLTHGRDPIPHLPPRQEGYLHISTQIFYQKGQKEGYVVCLDGQSQDKNCSDKYTIDLDVFDHTTYYGYDFSQIIVSCQ